MNAAELQRVERIFHGACALDPDERPSYLDTACGDDPVLRTHVEELLYDDAEGVDPIDPASVRANLEAVLAAVEEEPPSGAAAGLPERIARYRVVRCIAVGGMATVYEAEQDSPRRRVAVKTLQRGAVSQQIMQRFHQEVEVLGRLRHPGIAGIIEAGTCDLGDGDRPFFAMEYVDGLDLLEYATKNELPADDRLELFVRVCDAVQSAHRAGIVHRDLKPRNILVEEAACGLGRGAESANGMGSNGGPAAVAQPKVLDFGVARVLTTDLSVAGAKTNAGQLVGTLPYMSPEQLVGDLRAIDHRSDVYALGVVLYELLSGHLPHDVTNRPMVDAARLIRDTEPRRLGTVDRRFRGELDAIVTKAIAREPSSRYATASDLARDIRRYLSREPIKARPPSFAYRLRKFVRRNPLLVVSSAATFLAVVTGLALTMTFAMQSRRHLQEADRAVYQSGIAAANSALLAGDPRAARRHLARIREADRSWEWHHLEARLDPVLAVHELEAEAPVTDRCAFRPDGSAVLAILRAGAVAIVDMESSEPLGAFGAGSDPTFPTLSRDGRWLAAVCATEGVVRIWDTTGTAETRRVAIPSGEPIGLRLGPDAKLIAIVTTDMVRVVETDTWRVRLDHAANRGPSRNVVLGVGGERVAVLDGSSLRVLDTRTGAILGERELTVDATRALALQPEGESVAVGAIDVGAYVRLFDGETLEPQDQVLGHVDPVRGVAWSPDGRLLARASNESVIVWNPSARTPPQSFLIDPEPSGLVSIAFSDDGSRLAIAGGSRAQLVDITTSPSLNLRAHDARLRSLAFSPDGSMIAARDKDGNERWWDTLTGVPLLAARDLDGGGFPWGPGFAGNGSPLSGSCFPQVRAASDLEDEETGGDFGSARREPRKVRSRAGGLVAESTLDGVIVVTEDRTGSERCRLTGHEGALTAMAVGPHGRLLVSSGTDLKLRAWDVVSGTRIAVMDPRTSRVNCISFSPDGTRIATGSNDGTIGVWDAGTLDRVTELRGHERYVYAIAFSPDGRRIASASGDRTVKIWDSRARRTRLAESRALSMRREELRPTVASLLAGLGDPQLVAERVAASAEMSCEDRVAAMRVLLELIEPDETAGSSPTASN